jgi:hypothetical protein
VLTEACKRDLLDLRTAARDRQPEPLQFLTRRLLMQLDYFAALAVTLEPMQRFLELFESYYPEETWVRSLLVGIAAFGAAPDTTAAEMALQQSFPAPGAANYLKALYDLTQAMHKQHTGEARVSYMTSAIVNALMAELVEAWYGERPEAWEQARRPADDPQARAAAAAFWLDDTTAALDTSAWLAVAASLEQALQRQFVAR